jgi:hypothetical protein
MEFLSSEGIWSTQKLNSRSHLVSFKYYVEFLFQKGTMAWELITLLARNSETLFTKTQNLEASKPRTQTSNCDMSPPCWPLTEISGNVAKRKELTLHKRGSMLGAKAAGATLTQIWGDAFSAAQVRHKLHSHSTTPTQRKFWEA